MKKLLLSVFAIAALASCMQDETLGAAQRENIVFENAFVDNATKAIDPSITTTGENAISKFYVWGTTYGDHKDAKIVPIFDTEEVVKVDSKWYYAEGRTQYWIDGNKYNFAAVLNGTVESLVKGLPEVINYDLVGTNGADLLYARSKEIEGQASGNKEVAFTFEHLLSKAVFTFTNTTPENTNGSPSNIYKVTDIKVKGIACSADYTVSTKTWSDHIYAPIATESFGNIVAVAEQDKNKEALAIFEQEVGKSNYERLLIPGKYTVKISCTITLYNDTADEDRIVDVINYEKKVELDLKKGIAYNFCLSAGLTEPIEFKVEAVNTWKEPTDVEVKPVPGHDNTPEENN